MCFGRGPSRHYVRGLIFTTKYKISKPSIKDKTFWKEFRRLFLLIFKSNKVDVTGHSNRNGMSDLSLLPNIKSLSLPNTIHCDQNENVASKLNKVFGPMDNLQKLSLSAKCFKIYTFGSHVNNMSDFSRTEATIWYWKTADFFQCFYQRQNVLKGISKIINI
jgi:hypothetical protein